MPLKATKTVRMGLVGLGGVLWGIGAGPLAGWQTVGRKTGEQCHFCRALSMAKGERRNTAKARKGSGHGQTGQLARRRELLLRCDHVVGGRMECRHDGAR